MIRPEDETHAISGPEPEGTIQTSLELHIRSGGGPTRVLPFHRASLDCLGVTFRYLAGTVCFETDQEAYQDGVAVRQGVLAVGGHLEVQGARVLLWDHSRSTAYLKGYSGAYSERVWPLDEGIFSLGRPGRRDNQIQLDHPTVSREHATLSCQQGRYRLLAESTTNPVLVGGHRVNPGQSVTLSPGDLIEIGALVFRFHSLLEESPGLIRVRSLGTLQVSVGGRLVDPKAWKTQATRWLMARLAYQWGRPIASDILMAELWPDFPADKAKNNFNATISSLRGALRDLLGGREPVLRSSSTLQLDPELLDSHDLMELQRDLKGAAECEKHAERAVLAYTEPYLSDCYLEWVQPVRQALELELLQVARRLLEARAARQEWKEIIPVANQVLKIDPCSSHATLHLMQALRQSLSGAEALRVFEQHKKLLQRELGAEPEVELLKEYLLLTQSL